MSLKIETILNGPFQENCYIVYDEITAKGVFIDPGAEPERLMKAASRLKIDIIAIYNTHAHIDHAGGVETIKRAMKIPFAMNTEDDFLLKILPDQARMFGVPVADIPTVDIPLKHNDSFVVGNLNATVIHTPGHTPGGVCFLFGRDLFSGDTLFAGSIGRTDLPGGSSKMLIDSINTRLLCLSDEVKVYPGHGPSTTIGFEKRRNPFLNGSY